MNTQSLTLTLTLTVTLALTKTLVCASIKLLSEVRGGQKVPKMKISGIFEKYALLSVLWTLKVLP